MARKRGIALLTVLALLACPAAANAATRVALVIGNGAYQEVAQLANPPHDARDIADSFERLGFAVTRLMDGTADGMRKALVTFGQAAQGSEMAIIYYAGHGMEVGGENWLVPVDARLASDTDIESEAVSLKAATLQVGKARQLGLIILDACRNNPFAAKMRRSLRTRAVTRGLAPTEPTDNVLVAYSAKDGTTASDGDGKNSPFTAALLHNIETPGLEVTFLFRNVRDEVMAATNREQQPFVYGSLSREAIYLKPGTAEAAGSAPQPAAQAWAEVKDSSNPDVIASFLKYYGDGFYGELARARLAELKKTVVAALPAAARGVSAAAETEATVPFGGPPFCRYTVTLKNPRIAIPSAKPGPVGEATLSVTMVEATVPPCKSQGLGTQEHTYTGSGTIGADHAVTLTFAAAATNRPKATAAFAGKVEAGRLVGALSVQRLSNQPVLVWTVVSQFK